MEISNSFARILVTCTLLSVFSLFLLSIHFCWCPLWSLFDMCLNFMLDLFMLLSVSQTNHQVILGTKNVKVTGQCHRPPRYHERVWDRCIEIYTLHGHCRPGLLFHGLLHFTFIKLGHFSVVDTHFHFRTLISRQKGWHQIRLSQTNSGMQANFCCRICLIEVMPLHGISY
jgi:hypothetical protein